jgi:hypothetical protein
VVDPVGSRTDLAAVLRRLATDAQFSADVVADPTSALARYQLSGNDLAALALWLDQPLPGRGLDALFDPDTNDPPPRP